MQNPFEKTDVKFAEVVKKEWAAPVFEIISKEIIQNGLAPGAEGTPSVAGGLVSS